jgi:hypothetical protein
MTDQSLMDKSLRSVFGELEVKIICVYTKPVHTNILCIPYFRCSYVEALGKKIIFISVGNIPYEATEEKLKDIFSEAGPVVSFKYVTNFF